MFPKKLAGALLIAAFIMAAPLSARAQTPSTGYSFDGYRAMAITAGIVGGVIVAAIVTDGLIIPILAATTGAAETGGMAGAMAGAGGRMAAGIGEGAARGYGILRGTMRLLGAVSGGMYADALYLNR